MNSGYNQKLSIVHINTHDVAGGAAKVAWRLAEAQRQQEQDSKMLVGQKMCDSPFSTAFPVESYPAAAKYCADNGQLFYGLGGSHKLVNHHLVDSADILHLHNIHGWYFNPFSLSALSHFRPVVWTLHDMQAITGHCSFAIGCPKWESGCHQCPHIDREYKLAIDTSSQLLQDKKLVYDHSYLHLVTPSKWLKNKVERSVLKDHPVELIYNGVDTNIFRPYDKIQAKRKFGIPSHVPVIGAVANGGALKNHWKGGEYAEAVLKALPGLVGNFAFVNIGGDYETDDPRVISIPNITDESELAQAYSALDIFLNTSKGDNCPLVILEALSCGVPVVSFATGGIGELALDGQQGCVVPFPDQQKLIGSLCQLIKNPDLRLNYHHSARQRAISMFDHKAIAHQYNNLYLRILKENETKTITPKMLPVSKMPMVAMTQ